MNRRSFLLSSTDAVVAAPFISTTAGSHHEKIRIGQIGTKHGHASGKMKALRTQPKSYEVIGIFEPDPKQRGKPKKYKAYENVPWMKPRAATKKGSTMSAWIKWAVR